MTPDGLTPREAALLWLAAHAEWEWLADLLWRAVFSPPLLTPELYRLFGRFRREGWVEFYPTIPQADGYSRSRAYLTAAGRLAATFTPALLHHAGACVGRRWCPVCKEAA